MTRTDHPGSGSAERPGKGAVTSGEPAFWSFIVVGYKTAVLLPGLARSVAQAFPRATYEIIYVDNSDDVIPEAIEELGVRYERAERNLGFAAACNRGAQRSRGRVLCFLNPDCIVDAVGDVRDVISSPHAVWIPYVKEGQRGDHYGGYRNRFPILRPFLESLLPERRGDGWYRGSAVIMCREVYDRLGGWDERYFMYGEDMDLFWTARTLNLPVRRAAMFVAHSGGAASGKVWNTYRRERMVQRATLKFFGKVGARWSAFTFYPALLVFATLRAPVRNWPKLWAFVAELVALREEKG